MVRCFFTKIVQKVFSAAGMNGAIGCHLLKFRYEHFRYSRVSFDLYELSQLNNVCEAEEKKGLAWKSITTRASRFLIVAFNVLREIHMDYKTHVGFVYPHAKCNGCDNNAYLVVEKFFLVSRSHSAVHSCMIGECVKTIFPQVRCQSLGGDA